MNAVVFMRQSWQPQCCGEPEGYKHNHCPNYRSVSGAGATDAVLCEHHALGGAGATDLGNAVISVCQQKVDFKFLYELNQSIKVSLATEQHGIQVQPEPLTHAWPASCALQRNGNTLHQDDLAQVHFAYRPPAEA